jgi:hypothetical protein
MADTGPKTVLIPLGSNMQTLPPRIDRFLSVDILHLVWCTDEIACRAQEWHTNSIDGVINPAEYILWQFLQAGHPCEVALVIMVPPILLAVLLNLVPEVSKLWYKLQQTHVTSNVAIAEIKIGMNQRNP